MAVRYEILLLLLPALATCAPQPKTAKQVPPPIPVPSPERWGYVPPPYPERPDAGHYDWQQQTADYLLVDKSDRVLVAYRHGRPLRVYYGIGLGDAPQGHKHFQGDERTPEGLYTINTRNPRSSYHLSLKISYPNASDRAFAESYGRSPGGDIFIHGQPNGMRNGRMTGDWTDGCIAVSNAEIEELWAMVPDGTPIEIRP